jgi:hypothetical protein
MTFRKKIPGTGVLRRALRRFEISSRTPSIFDVAVNSVIRQTLPVQSAPNDGRNQSTFTRSGAALEQSNNRIAHGTRELLSIPALSHPRLPRTVVRGQNVRNVEEHSVKERRTNDD